jgi:glycosyltransferase involved in cell wall biosynthesis
MNELLKILVMADGTSIHTEKWLKGLSSFDELELYLLTMNPVGLREGIINNPKIKSIFRVFAGTVQEKGDNFQYLMNIPKVYRIVKSLNPQIINTVYLTSYGFLGALCKRRSFLCHFMIGTDIMVTPSQNRLYRWITRYALSRGDFLVSSSSTMTRRLHDLATISEERLLTQQYGVDDEVIHYPEQVKDYDFISNRAWVPNSNIPMILDIFANLNAHVSLALVGDGGPQELHIKEKMRNLPGAKHLGRLPFADNIHAVASSKYYISLTSSDGASLSLMEAMALGAIPIVSNIEPNREWVQDGVNGYLLELDDLPGSVKKIESVLTLSEVELERMRRINREIILQRGSLSINMKRFVDAMICAMKGQSLS